ncbi:phospholipid-transporting ATPase ABCA3 [Cochliomyia hominivorax]
MSQLADMTRLVESVLRGKLQLKYSRSRSQERKRTFQSEIKLDDLSLFREIMNLNDTIIPYSLYFTPNTDRTKEIFQIVSRKLQLNGATGFPNEKKMVENFKSKSVLAAVVLEPYNITLRFPNYFRTRPYEEYYFPEDFWLTKCISFLDDEDYYVREGFLTLLYTIVTTQMELEGDGETFVKPTSFSSMNYTMLPNIGCVNDLYHQPMTPERFLNWSLYYFIYFVPFLNLLWKLAREHEENIFVHHRIYGFKYNDHIIGHFIIALTHFILLDLLVFGFTVYIWPSTSDGKYFLLFGFLIIYNMILIIYAMIWALFWSNAKTSLWFGVALWMSSYLICSEILNTISFIVFKANILTISIIFCNNLLPNGLFEFLEEGEIPDLFKAELLILIIYGCLLKSLNFYKPGRYIKHSSKLLSFKSSNPLKMNPTNIDNNLYRDNMEHGPLDGLVLELQNISSFVKGSKLNNISIKFFKSEISVLLGPQASGKTSLISVLAGWQSFRGEIIYHSQNFKTTPPISRKRQQFDVSMPNNNLYDLLTIEETLKYFILLKKQPELEFHQDHELQKWLNILKPIITNKQILVKNLNFGEKRILVLCCTLLCKTTVVLLDEPTLQMKLEDQFNYWNILKKEKHNRVIILATNSIDEAADVGDRIAILNEGSLIAWGSSYFLRHKFGNGLYLICFLQPMTPITGITKILENYVTNFNVYQHFSDRVIYILPSDRKSLYQKLLIDLEKDVTKLGITKINISGSGINDVYMNLTLKQDSPLIDVKNNVKFIPNKQHKTVDLFVRAIFYKKLCQQAKNILPICIIFAACFLVIAIDQLCYCSFKVGRIIVLCEYSMQMSDILNKLDVTTDKAKFNFTTTINPLEGNETMLSNTAILNYKSPDIQHGLFHYKTMKTGAQSRANSLAYIYNDGDNKLVKYNHGIFHSTILALHMTFGDSIRNMIFTNKPIILHGNHNLYITLGTIMPLTMSMVFIILQEERYNKMQILQRIAGLKDYRKWMVTFLWDFLIYLLISILYFIIIITCVLHFVTGPLIVALLVLVILNGIASLLFMYIMFFIIKEENKSRGFLKIFFIQTMLGLFLYILYIHVFINTFDTLYYILMISPGFSVLSGMNRILNNHENLNLASYFQWEQPGFLDSITFILITSLIYLLTFIAIIYGQQKYQQSTKKRTKEMFSLCYPYDEDQVIKEKVRIANMNLKACKSQAILVDQLENKLPKTGKRINTISFSSNRYQCLGIYGSYNSGKSHLLKQLIGEKSYWFGNVFVAGSNLKKQKSQALENLGFCPQRKGFNNLLTPQELFTIFLMLNGFKKSQRFEQIRDFCAILKLHNFMKSRMSDIPHNIRRRVNIAVALIAYKDILIIDEPTKGLPAHDRLLIWNFIKYYRGMGKTIIFCTSESLELKELSDVVMVVNEGEMLMYDNAHNMEFQYNKGFYLEFKLYADGDSLKEVEDNYNTDVENLNRFVMFFHDDSELLYRSGNIIKYYIPVENVIYSHIFGTIEKYRYRLNIADYTLSPYSLNNVLRLLQKARNDKKSLRETNLLKDTKILPKKDYFN